LKEEVKIDKDQIVSSVHSLLKGMVDSKLLTEELPILIDECIQECDIPLLYTEDTDEELGEQVEYYSGEFNKIKDELLGLIIKKETAKYGRLGA
jgi:hypothetical protein